MGEVRVKVKLSNHVDRFLAGEGQIAPSSVRSYMADAMVDTGSVRCALPAFVAHQLGLRSVTTIRVEYADGRKEDLPVTTAFNLEIMGRDEVETAVIVGDEVLIGQTAFEKMDLLVDCTRQQLVSNPSHPDQPINKLK